MKIGVIQGAFFPVPPLRGGAVEKLWHRLAMEFARNGHEVTHVSRLCDGLPATNEEAGVMHRRVSGYDQPANGLRLKLRDLQYSLRAVRALPKETDIVVTNTFWSPLLMRKHRGVYVSVERMPKGQMRLYNKAARLRGCSSAVKDAILRECPSAAPRVVVVPNPLPFSPDHDVHWERKRKNILYVGRLHPEKGIALLLEAFIVAKARGALTNWTLELIGPVAEGRGGGGEAWLGALRRRLCHRDILWSGPIYEENLLNAQYEQAAVFVYPSVAERGETFGLSALEAMAWGATPVVSDLACFRDFIRHDHNGLIFNHRGGQSELALAQALTRVADVWPRLGPAGVEVRESHGKTKIAESFLDDFERVLNGRRGHPVRAVNPTTR